MSAKQVCFVALWERVYEPAIHAAGMEPVTACQRAITREGKRGEDPWLRPTLPGLAFHAARPGSEAIFTEFTTQV